jgi:hypothetical protein
MGMGHKSWPKLRTAMGFLFFLIDPLLGWDDIGTRTKVPLRFVTYLSKVR